MEKIKIGQIVNAVALKGEVKVYHYSDYKERFEELDTVLIGEEAYRIENVRYMKEMPVIKFKGVDDRNAAEALKTKAIYITDDNLRELPDDTFYIRDLVGCAVKDYETGKTLGKITDVLQNSAQDIYCVKLTDGRDSMIPAVTEFIKEVDIKAASVMVSLIPGLISSAEGVTLEDSDDDVQSGKPQALQEQK